MQFTPVVVTSINPFGRIAHQLRCFQAWKDLGVRVYSVNISEEAAKLREVGLSDADLIELAPGETGKNMYRIPVPRILPVLYRVRHAAAGGPAMLVNSDLFPAIRSAAALQHWANRAGALALTREECASPETHDFLVNRPYRGGLDAFLFSAEKLDLIIPALHDCAAAERMAFGIPGWDYLMGMLVRSPQIGGMIADSGMLLHESHAATYNTMDEFAHYLPDMARLTGLTLADPTSAAAQIAELIMRDCQKNTGISAIAKALYYQPPQDQAAPGPRATTIAQTLLDLSPALSWLLKGPAIARLAEREMASPRPSFSRASALFEVNPDPQYRFTQRLCATLFCLMCRNPGSWTLTTRYPEGNLHGKVIRIILENCPEGSPMRRLEFAQIFGSEMIDHGIFNPRLYNYLVESCETDEERALLAAIWTNIRSFSDAA